MKSDVKKTALEKLDKMLAFIAYPDRILDNKTLDEYHKDLRVNSSSFLMTMLNYNLFERKHLIKSLRIPNTRDDWTDEHRAAAQVKAYYNCVKNALGMLCA